MSHQSKYVAPSGIMIGPRERNTNAERAIAPASAATALQRVRSSVGTPRQSTQIPESARRSRFQRKKKLHHAKFSSATGRLMARVPAAKAKLKPAADR